RWLTGVGVMVVTSLSVSPACRRAAVAGTDGHYTSGPPEANQNWPAVALWAPAAGTAIIAAATQIQPPGKDRDPAMTPPRSIRGAFLDLVNDPFLADAQECVRFVPDGLLVVEDGMIRDFGRYADLAAKYPGLPVTAFPDRLIVPGLIDCHIHYPQSR